MLDNYSVWSPTEGAHELQKGNLDNAGTLNNLAITREKLLSAFRFVARGILRKVSRRGGKEFCQGLFAAGTCSMLHPPTRTTHRGGTSASQEVISLVGGRTGGGGRFVTGCTGMARNVSDEGKCCPEWVITCENAWVRLRHAYYHI